MMTKPGSQHEEVVKMLRLCVRTVALPTLLPASMLSAMLEKVPESECDGMVANSSICEVS
jgi:hypothetical protein